MAGSGDRRERDRESHYRCAVMLHPLRQRIAGAFSRGKVSSVAELATELEVASSRVAHHVRVLTRHGVLRVVPRQRPTPPLFRWSDAQWAEEMLGEGDE